MSNKPKQWEKVLDLLLPGGLIPRSNFDVLKDILPLNRLSAYMWDIAQVGGVVKTHKTGKLVTHYQLMNPEKFKDRLPAPIEPEKKVVEAVNAVVEEEKPVVKKAAAAKPKAKKKAAVPEVKKPEKKKAEVKKKSEKTPIPAPAVLPVQAAPSAQFKSDVEDDALEIPSFLKK
jgi:hypothetical protein